MRTPLRRKVDHPVNPLILKILIQMALHPDLSGQ